MAPEAELTYPQRDAVRDWMWKEGGKIFSAGNNGFVYLVKEELLGFHNTDEGIKVVCSDNHASLLRAAGVIDLPVSSVTG